MTHRGPFQPRTFCGSLYCKAHAGLQLCTLFSLGLVHSGENFRPKVTYKLQTIINEGWEFLYPTLYFVGWASPKNS